MYFLLYSFLYSFLFVLSLVLFEKTSPVFYCLLFFVVFLFRIFFSPYLDIFLIVCLLTLLLHLHCFFQSHLILMNVLFIFFSVVISLEESSSLRQCPNLLASRPHGVGSRAINRKSCPEGVAMRHTTRLTKSQDFGSTRRMVNDLSPLSVVSGARNLGL